MASPLTKNIDLWQHELQLDKDKVFLLHGLLHGFSIVDKTDIPPVEMDNYASATCPENRDATECQILQEIAAGNYKLGRQPVVSALGAIPKPGSHEVRLIHDASRPYGYSLNSYAYLEQERVHYVSMDHLTSKLKAGAWLAKIDLRHAYRSVPISPTN